MSNNFGYIDIILLAMIAGFIILRLRNILGKKTGHEDKGLSGFSEKRFEQFKKQTINKNDEIHKKGLVGIQREDFLKGAEVAYETIITSFANSDIKKLKSLLSPKMFVNFEEAVLQKNKDNIKSELTFIGMKESKLEKFEEIKNEFFATVKFVCEIISVKKDKDDKVIEGNPDIIKTVTDHWKFSKNISSNNPNWNLSEIISK